MWQLFLIGFIIIELWIILGGFFFSKESVLESAKDLSEHDRFFWLNEQEKVEFKNEYEEYSQALKEIEKEFEEELEEYKMVQDRISDLHYAAQENGISTNKDGSYSQRSHLGKKIQGELDTLDRISLPSKPSFAFQSSLTDLPKSRWKSFNDLWTRYNHGRNAAKSFLWAFCGWLISTMLVEWFTDGPIGFVTFFVAGIGATIFFVIAVSLYKKEMHNIPVPEDVTLENVDTHIELKYSLNLCRTFKCFLKDLSGFRNKETSLDWVNLPLGQITNLTKLKLSGNQLTELPKEIAQLTNLTELELSGNQLTELPKEIAQLTSLIKLDLSENANLHLTPEQIEKLEKNNCIVLR